jgi:SAM-dependent methyltransferase
MSEELEFTGERFVPGVIGEIAHEHWHRYAFARRFAAGRRVLDVACGEGYGSALLAGVAREVTGIDIAAEAVAHACEQYRDRANLAFLQGSATGLRVPDASVDLVVSFETIEHLPRSDQPRVLAEFARVLTDDGLLMLSAPNPIEYSTARNYRNPFHLHEPSREELEAQLAAMFPARRWYRQRRYFGSALWSEAGDGGFEVLEGDAAEIGDATVPAAMYFVVLAARHESVMPPGPRASFFSEPGEAELARMDARSAEILRLDTLLGERDAALDRQTGHVQHLERLAAAQDSRIAEQDAQLAQVAAAHANLVAARDDAAQARDEALAALASARQAEAALRAEGERLERALAAQERIIAYRQSARWWLALPWMRIRMWWQQRRAP